MSVDWGTVILENYTDYIRMFTWLVAVYVRVFCFLNWTSCFAKTVQACLFPALAAFFISASSFASSLSSPRLSRSTSLVCFRIARSPSRACSEIF